MLHNNWEEITNPLLLVNVWETIYKDLFRHILLTTNLEYEDLINFYLSSKSIQKKFDVMPKIWYELFKRDFNFPNISWDETKSKFYKTLYIKCTQIIKTLIKPNNEEKEEEKESKEEAILKRCIVKKNFDMFLYLYKGLSQKEKLYSLQYLRALCIEYDSSSILSYLLTKVNIGYNEGKNCIIFNSIKCFKKLLHDDRLDVHTLYLLLKFAIRNLSEEEGEEENKDIKYKFIRKLLKDKRIDLTQNNDYCLCKAVYGNHHKIVELLIRDRYARSFKDLEENLPDPSFEDNYCIAYAMQEGYVETVRILLRSELIVKELETMKNILVKYSRRYEIVSLLRGVNCKREDYEYCN